MIEIGAVYTLTGPDGTQAVLNDTTASSGVGWLRELGGLDSPELRIEVTPLGQQDGAFFNGGRGYWGPRQITMGGLLIPGAAVDVNRREMLLRRATESIAADGYLTWWPAGFPELQIAVRRTSPLRVRGGRPREFQIGLTAVDPRIYSAAPVAVFTTLAETPEVVVSTNPAITLTGPVVRAGNVGSTYAPLEIIVTGPVTNPEIKLYGTDYSLKFPALELAAGETITINTLAQTVLRNGTQNAYPALDFINSVFFFLPPEASTYIQLTGSGMADTTGLRVTYRHTWI